MGSFERTATTRRPARIFGVIVGRVRVANGLLQPANPWRGGSRESGMWPRNVATKRGGWIVLPVKPRRTFSCLRQSNWLLFRIAPGNLAYPLLSLCGAADIKMYPRGYVGSNNCASEISPELSDLYARCHLCRNLDLT